MQARTEGVARIVGREPEYTVLREFLGADSAVRALALVGGPGIGKTTLWEAGIALGAGARVRVLVARPSGAEAQLSFAALIDLFDGVDPGALAVAGAPASLRSRWRCCAAEPAGAPPPSRTRSRSASCNALRALAARRAAAASRSTTCSGSIAPSADALAFAARRLEGDAGRLPARQAPRSSDRARARARAPRASTACEVGPLSLGATRRLLSERLGLSLSRQLLRRIVESTLGNPLFALEIGRALVERGLPEIGEDIPVPDAVEDMLGTRVARLPGAVRRLLLAVALSGDLRTAELAAIGDAGRRRGRRRCRPAAASTATACAPRTRCWPRRRGSARGRGSGASCTSRWRSAVADEELRALHLALATERPDDELAATVAAAAAPPRRAARGRRRCGWPSTRCA